MKELIIIRHAKSSWENSNLHDRDRPLALRGLHDIPLVSKVLLSQGYIPDRVYSSPAVRAYETAKGICAVLGFPLEQIALEDCLYFGEMDEILRLLHATPDTCERLFIFGHDPTFSELAAKLCRGFHADMPTCAYVVLGFPGGWPDVTTHAGELKAYNYPKKLR